MITAGLNFLFYPFFSDALIIEAMSFILGLSLGCTQPSILSLLQQHAPDGRKSEVFGMRMALINGSQVSLPMAFGAVGSLIGVMPLFWGTALVVTSGAWFTRRAGRQLEPQSDTSRPSAAGETSEPQAPSNLPATPGSAKDASVTGAGIEATKEARPDVTQRQGPSVAQAPEPDNQNEPKQSRLP